MMVLNGLILKGDRIVIPQNLRPSMFKKMHAGHLGQEKCKRWARGTIFGPGINKNIEKMVNRCSICLVLRDRPPP